MKRFLAILLLFCTARAFAAAPTTAPTTLPILAAGQAPCVAHFDVRSFGDCQYDRFAWNFGDGVDTHADPRHLLDPANFKNEKISDNNTLPEGAILSHLYENPGQFKATCQITHRDGSGSTVIVPVLVNPDARRHVTITAANVDQFASVSAGSDVYVRADPGLTLKLTETIQLTKNPVIECTGEPKAKIVPPTGGPAFAGWPGRTSDVLIRNFACDAGGVPAKTAGGYEYTACGGALFATIRGDRFAVVNCDLYNLSCGVKIPDIANGVLIDGLQQKVIHSYGDPGSQLVMITGGQKITIRHCSFLNSTSESPIRTTGFGAADGLTITNNLLSQDIDLAHGRGLTKAVVTLRNASDYLIAFNAITNGEVSTNPAGVDVNVVKASGTLVQHGCIKWNVLQSPNSPCFLHIQATTVGLNAHDNEIQRNEGPAITISPDQTGVLPLSDVLLKHNPIFGINVRAIQFDKGSHSGVTLSN